jgi:hypothetical protein
MRSDILRANEAGADLFEAPVLLSKVLRIEKVNRGGRTKVEIYLGTTKVNV